MGWLNYSGLWINLVFNPLHWIFELEFGGLGLRPWMNDEEDTEWFWCHMLFGPINFRIVIDNGKYANDDSDLD